MEIGYVGFHEQSDINGKLEFLRKLEPCLKTVSVLRQVAELCGI